MMLNDNLIISQYLILSDNVQIQAKLQRDKSIKWAVVSSSGFVFSKELKCFEYEPMPSSRTDEFLADTRFGSAEEAYYFYIENRDVAKENNQ